MATERADPRSSQSIPGRPVLWLLLAVAFGAMASMAWAMPLQAEVTELRPVSMEFTFDYRAPLPENVVYDAPSLEFGDAVFFSVVDQLTVDVGWRVPSPDAFVSSGELTVSVLVESGAGWERTLSVAPPQQFADRSVATTVAVDFPAAVDLSDQIDSVVGATGALTVRVVAVADVTGAVSRPGQSPVPLDKVSSAELVFDVTSSSATMRDAKVTNGGAAPSTPSRAVVDVAEASSATAATPSRAGVQPVVQMLPTTVPVANQVSLGVVDVDVGVMRYAATALAGVCAFIGVSGLVISRRSRRKGEAAYIAARYGSRLLPLRSMPDVRSNAPFELTNFDALLAVASQLGLPVLVDESGQSTSYYVADALSTFVYTASGTTRTKAQERQYRKRERALDRIAERERKENAKRDKQLAQWARDDQVMQARRDKERAEWARVDQELELQRALTDDPPAPKA